MGDTAEARALIRTRPLDQANYGGILQAYALQETLRKLGFWASTDSTRGEAPGPPLRKLHARAKREARHLLAWLGVPRVTRASWVEESLRETRDAPVLRFVRERVRTVALYGPDGTPDPLVLESTEAFVVGSDQVWRAAFGRVPSYMLDFLDPSDSRPRVAYAASFGRDDFAEYDTDLVQRTAQLAQRLDAISVREDSGVELCRRYWGVAAEHVLDPTLLVSSEHYAAIAARDEPFAVPSSLVTYVLDPGPLADRLVAALEVELGQSAVPLLPGVPGSTREYRRRPEGYTRPSVEQWLGALATARFVVTDSFHGTVFAILSNVPFATVVNHARGAARFESLLGMLNLQDRMVEPGGALDLDVLSRQVDWASVNELVSRERERSVEFLTRALKRATTEPGAS